MGWSFLTARYAVYDGMEHCLAEVRANRLYSLWRLRWTGYRPDHSCWFVAVEESWIFPRVLRGIARFTLAMPELAILLLAGLVLLFLLCQLNLAFLAFPEPLLLLVGVVLWITLAVLRSVGFLMRKLSPNCLIVQPNDGAILGTLDRQRDDKRVRLDLVADQDRLDRRVGVAVALLMDKP